jgi:hypothetical protein
MTGNSEAPLEHLVNPAVCKAVGVISRSASRLGTYFFRKWGRGGRGPGASPGVPNPPPGPPPPRRLAAQNGKGELCTALKLGFGSMGHGACMVHGAWAWAWDLLVAGCWGWGLGLGGLEIGNWKHPVSHAVLNSATDCKPESRDRSEWRVTRGHVLYHLSLIAAPACPLYFERLSCLEAIKRLSAQLPSLSSFVLAGECLVVRVHSTCALGVPGSI